MAVIPKKLTALDVVHDAPVIPVIVLHELRHAVPLARALVAGGIRMLEVTLRTPVALDCVRAMVQEVPEAVAGVGTVRTGAEAEAAQRAGAAFAVSPGFTLGLARTCAELGLPWLPGVATASEILAAQEAGLSALKFFPAMQAGGVGLLKAWQGPFPEVVFCPTGGVQPDNAPSLLALGNVACVGGSWLVPTQALEDRDWARITALAREACALRPKNTVKTG
ncbi:bifunctional 4-hydroxy-2-oxoglutarate aldolase/2-dehydro-3-deoxy-phosphogluconate aldolase [Melaminivora sp.]|uniref:bifunctional 4-hydroxy-2-oxoglutarate aldolase/2-dehydro-3-deoxy-phosphogluconate aldolase n=1 Tax=Melaminivora sp. TaxID=1933032 RepID=UPI0028A946D3|nr:bifunctional 4-hydroxy-2-oxoglutarate aldolase/2-dehydro-3-deoxy-phosphogluconate aldolase [Melaminivora sp.]